MSLGKILGTLDLISVIIFSLFFFKIIGTTLFAIALLYIVGKAIMFIKDPASIADLIAGVIILSVLIFSVNIISWLAVAWFVQKGFLSLMA